MLKDFIKWSLNDSEFGLLLMLVLITIGLFSFVILKEKKELKTAEDVDKKEISRTITKLSLGILVFCVIGVFLIEGMKSEINTVLANENICSEVNNLIYKEEYKVKMILGDGRKECEVNGYVMDTNDLGLFNITVDKDEKEIVLEVIDYVEFK